MANAMLMIRPYWKDGTWVFDDAAVGLRAEPFVAGVPEMITRLTEAAGIRNARKGFRLLFSASSFPGHAGRFTRTREESGGTWYRDEVTGAEGWLCPALFKYFDTAPAQLYAKAEAIAD